MGTERTYHVGFAAIAAMTLITGCMPRGSDLDASGAVIPTGDQSMPLISQRAASDTVMELDRAPYVTRTPMALIVPVDPVLPTPTSPPAPAQAGSQDTLAEPTSADVAVVAQSISAVPSLVNAEPSASESVGAVVALPRVTDVDPAPPFAVLVDSVRLVDDGVIYKVTGRIRNDGNETYEGVGLEATFYDGSAWHFGPFDATCGCYTLEPGQSCAFSVDAYARDYTGYRLHPEGSPLKAWTGGSTVLTVGDVIVADKAAGYVHLTGIVRNQTGSTVTAVRVSAELADSDGLITSVGSMIVSGQLGPGAEAPFSLRVPADAYASYRVSAEGALQ